MLGRRPVATGDRLGKYEIVQLVAQGGMGEIYLAHQTSVVGFSRPVILKTLLPELTRRDDLRAAFLDEARICATLNHPNIVAIYDIDKFDEMYFLAMEYIEGDTLSALRKKASDRGVTMPLPVIAKIIRDTAVGLDHAHHARDADDRRLNIVHRDITPQNIMVRRDGVVKIVDFGIAKTVDSASRTGRGVVKGKLSYLSPEQIRGEGIDHRVDQFALGIVFWELVTGRRLFEGEATREVLAKILQGRIPAPSSVNPEVDDALEGIILRMLSVDRDARYSRCASVARRLTRYLEMNPVLSNHERMLRALFDGDTEIRSTTGSHSDPQSTQSEVVGTFHTCVGCGERSPWTARFCASCGRALNNEAAPSAFDDGETLRDVPLRGKASTVDEKGGHTTRDERSADAAVGLDAVPRSPMADAPSADAASAYEEQTPTRGHVPGPAFTGASTVPEPLAQVRLSVDDIFRQGVGTAVKRSGTNPSFRMEPATGAVVVGRREECAEAGRLLREALVGQNRLAMFVGPSGSGKSALLDRVEELATAARLRVYRLQGRGYGPTAPFDLFRCLFEHDSASSSTIDDSLAQLDVDAATREGARLALRGAAVDSPEVAQNREAAIRTCVTALARGQGICILVDDLDRTDPDSQRVLASLAEAPPTGPLAVVAASTPDVSLPLVARWPMERLSDAEVLEALGRKIKSDEVSDLIATYAEGRPAVAVELCAYLEHIGAVEATNDGLVPTPRLRSLSVPRDPLSLTVTRIRDLGPDTVRFLIAGSTVGISFDRNLAGAAAQLGPMAVESAQREAVRAGLLAPHPRRPQELRFTQARYLDALQRSRQGETLEYHLRIAAALNTDDEATTRERRIWHLLAGHQLPAGDTRALDVARALARRGARWSAADVYEKLVDHAVALAGRKDTDWGALLRWALEGEPLWSEVSVDRAAETLSRVLSKAPDELQHAESLARLLRARARLRAQQGAFSDAERDLMQGLGLVREAVLPHLEASLDQEIESLRRRLPDPSAPQNPFGGLS